MATVSFIKEGVKSEDIVRHLLNHQVGIKHGNFYSVRLLEHLGIDVDDGVARVSFAHYNTHEEVDRLLAGLGEIV